MFLLVDQRYTAALQLVVGFGQVVQAHQHLVVYELGILSGHIHIKRPLNSAIHFGHGTFEVFGIRVGLFLLDSFLLAGD